MRPALSLLCLLTIALCAARASGAALDPSRITAIDQAAEAFLARAAASRNTGQVPRQSDLAVQQLIDAVFDTGELSDGAVPIDDLPKLDDWLTRIVAVGSVYLKAGHAIRDLGVFGAEIGRFLDASVALQRAIADCFTAELAAHPEAQPSPADQRKLVQLRGKITDTLAGMIDVLHTPGVTVGWVRERLTALTAAAPSLARFLTPEELARLRAATLRLAAQIRDKSLRRSFDGLAVALAEPPPPVAMRGAPSGDGEIALERQGQGYAVAVRINDALTVKFVVDSGADVVVLPSDLVEKLTGAGTIQSSDLRGRQVYVTADGRKHRGTSLMLRRLDVGGHTVTDVMASVAPAHAAPLLGQTFLAKFRSWTLDNRRHVLIIAE